MSIEDSLLFVDGAVYNVADPSNPFFLGLFSNSPPAHYIAHIAPRYPYAYGVGVCELSPHAIWETEVVYDISDPASPVPLFVHHGPRVRAERAYLRDDYLFVSISLSDFPERTRVFDVSQPDRLDLVFTFGKPICSRISSREDVLLASAGSGGLLIYSITAVGCDELVEPKVPQDLAESIVVSPNPCLQSPNIRFAIKRESAATINIFDVTGSLVRTIPLGIVAKGRHSINWDGKNEEGDDLPSGSYFLILETRSRRSVTKITLLR